MTETINVPMTAEAKSVVARGRHPFASLRREVDRLFGEFGSELWHSPFHRSLFDATPLFQRGLTVGTAPAVDIVDKDKVYEVTVDLPGFSEKDVEVKTIDGSLSIKGERKSEKEEKKEGYFLSEREFGSFERVFGLPEGVDGDKIEASLKKGVLTVTLPKKATAQAPVKKIEIKAGA